MRKPCSIKDCCTPSHGRGWCHKHYQRWQAHGDPVKLALGTLEERFHDKYIPEPNSGCWLWIANANRTGYGCLSDSKQRLAHRISWEIHRGPIPEGLYVLHKCDVPICVNPEHLFLGTHQDNMDDMVRKGRGRWNTRRAVK